MSNRQERKARKAARRQVTEYRRYAGVRPDRVFVDECVVDFAALEERVLANMVEHDAVYVGEDGELQFIDYKMPPTLRVGSHNAQTDFYAECIRGLDDGSISPVISRKAQKSPAFGAPYGKQK